MPSNVDQYYSSDKIRRELGWQPRYLLEASLRFLQSTAREEN